MKLLFVKLLFVFVLLLNSCMSPRVYVPAMPATPLFEKKKDVFFDLSGNVFGNIGGSFGVALTNGIGAYAGVGAHFGDDYNVLFPPDLHISSKTINSTLGLGFYRNISHSNIRRLECYTEFNRGAFEVFGASHSYSGSTRIDRYSFITGKYNQFSLLLNHSIKSYRKQYCFSFKLGASHFFEYLEDNDDPFRPVMIKLRNDQMYYNADLGVTYILGRREVKLKSQILFNYGMSSLRHNNNYPTLNCFTNIGLLYSPRYY